GWRSAHMQCRSTGGFLVGRKELLGASQWPTSSHSQMEKNHNLAWTGLTFIKGRPTWLTRCPGPASSGIIWDGNSIPEFGYGGCAAIDLSVGTFLTLNCDTQLPYICIKTETLIPGVQATQSSARLELVASGEASSVSWGSKDVFSVNQKQFRTLTLTCHLTDTTGNHNSSYFFWRKDGIILRNRNKSVRLSEIEDTFLNQFL
ncbi:unnamed protein product, partial [Meganyctiphanes norvegica]